MQSIVAVCGWMGVGDSGRRLKRHPMWAPVSCGPAGGLSLCVEPDSLIKAICRQAILATRHHMGSTSRSGSFSSFLVFSLSRHGRMEKSTTVTCSGGGQPERHGGGRSCLLALLPFHSPPTWAPCQTHTAKHHDALSQLLCDDIHLFSSPVQVWISPLTHSTRIPAAALPRKPQPNVPAGSCRPPFPKP